MMKFFYFVGIKRASFTREISYSILHVNRVWEPAQEVPSSKSCEASLTGCKQAILRHLRYSIFIHLVRHWMTYNANTVNPIFFRPVWVLVNAPYKVLLSGVWWHPMAAKAIGIGLALPSLSNNRWFTCGLNFTFQEFFAALWLYFWGWVS